MKKRVPRIQTRIQPEIRGFKTVVNAAGMRYTVCIIGERGLMLGGDCTIDAGIDRERLRWIAEAARSL